MPVMMKQTMILAMFLLRSSVLTGAVGASSKPTASGPSCTDGDPSCFIPQHTTMFQRTLEANKVLSISETRGTEDKADAEVTTQRSNQTAATLSQVQSLAENMIKNGGQLDDVTRGALEQVRLLMLDIINYTLIEHDEDQQELSAAAAAIINCHSKATSDLTAVSTLHATLEDNRSAHSTCRDTEVLKLKQMADKCKNFVDYANTGVELPDCTKNFPNGPNEATLKCIREVGKWFEAANSTYMDPSLAVSLLQEHGSTPGGGYVPRETRCEKATSILADTKDACDTKQNAFEYGFCNYASMLTKACDDQVWCRNASITARNATHKRVKISELGRKAENGAAKHVLCFLTVINETNQSHQPILFNGCRNFKANTSQLNLNYPDIPAEKACDKTPATHSPCDTAWQKSEYQSKGWYNSEHKNTLTDTTVTVVPHDCAQCPATTVPPAAIDGAPNVPGLWFHLAASTLAQSFSDGQKVHTWPAADGSGKDVVAHDASEDVTFKAKGSFSDRPVAYFSGKHKLCTTDLYPVIMELTVFWKGTFEQSKKNDWSHLVGQGHDQYWVLRRYGGHSQVTMHTRNANSPNTNMEWDKPIIIVGTVSGGTRTARVYDASDKREISTIEKTDSATIPAQNGQKMPVCIGVTEVYHNSGICQFRGEYEEVLVYDSVLSDADKDKIIDYLSQ